MVDQAAGVMSPVRTVIAVLMVMGAVSIGLVLLGVDLADTGDRPPTPPVRLWAAGAMVLLTLAIGISARSWWIRAAAVAHRRPVGLFLVAMVGLFATLSATFLGTLDGGPGTHPVVHALPLLLTGPILVVALVRSCWPPGLASVERGAVIVDVLVGMLGLGILWTVIVVPALPAAAGPWQSAAVHGAAAIELVLIATVLVVAALARRRGHLPLLPLILMQGSVLVLAGADVLIVVSPYFERGSSSSPGLVTQCAAGALVVALAWRDPAERERSTQLWLRDLWSTVIPLSPVVVAAASMLAVLALPPEPAQIVTPGRGGAAVALILLALVLSIIWLRIVAAQRLRTISVRMTAIGLDRATSQSWFQVLTRHSHEMMLLLDRRARVVFVSDPFARMIGVGIEALRGRDLSEVLPSLSHDEVMAALPDDSSQTRPPIEVTVTDATGQDHDVQFWVALSAGLETDGFVLTGTDVTDARRMRDMLGETRRRDRLTGLLNREAFVGAIADVRDWADIGSVAVLVVDLVGLRAVNDTVGHDVGDAILRDVAGTLERTGGPIMAVARIGGDGFGVLLRSETPHVAAQEVSDGIRASLVGIRLPDGSRTAVRAAAGYATAEPGDSTPTSLLEHADLAAASSRGDPRMKLVGYEPRMRESLLEEWQRTEQIRSGLGAQEFVAHYQPIVNLASGRLWGVEALARRRLADGTLQHPDVFIPLAERAGLVAQIDRAVRAAALDDLAALNTVHPDLRLSVNMSALAFGPELVPDVGRQLVGAGVDPSLVVVEVTESAVASSPEVGTRIIADLKDIGCHVALDDFGTGFSSLAGLAQMHVDIIKIDRSFVADIATGRRALSLLRAVVHLGRALGLKTVAEGIATIEQADILRGMGCDRGQGYLYAAPMALPEMLDWLSGRRGASQSPVESS